jgi:hypothetical protein
MSQKSFVRRTVVGLALTAAVAVPALIGTTGVANASTGGQIGLCPQGDYWSEVYFVADGAATVYEPWVAPGQCGNFTVPWGGNNGWAMHVIGGNNGDNHDFGVVAFVAQGTTGQNYHVYTYGDVPSGSEWYAIYAV